MVVTAGGLFAVNGTVAKLLLRGGFDAAQLATFRATGGFLGLAILVIARHGPRRLHLPSTELGRLIAFGLAGFLLVPLLYFAALNRLPVGIALLIEFMGPLFVALWVRFGQRQPVRSRLWAGLLLCLIGLFCVAQLWSGRLRLDPPGYSSASTPSGRLPTHRHYRPPDRRGLRGGNKIRTAPDQAAPAGPARWWACRYTPTSERSRMRWTPPAPPDRS
jgi:threonine/homoserine efflux transporter RhtA